MAKGSKMVKVQAIWWILVAVCFLLGAAGIITICILRSETSQLPYSYAIAIDAGSSRTDFYVYQWPTGKENGTGIAKQIYKCPSASDSKLRALASYASNPSQAGNQSIVPCMDRIIRDQVVPSTDYATTPVFVGATAGMRVLSLADNSSAEAILSSVRSTIASYPFLFSDPQQQARIISGYEEGAYGWVTSNYLADSFRIQPGASSSSGTTVGALDMGGASTQITFDPRIPLPDGQGFDVRLYGYSYRVYTHSYLCYGFDQANQRYKALLIQKQNFNTNIDDPCAPSGNVTMQAFSSIYQEPCTSPTALPANPQVNAVRNQTFTFRGTSNPDLCRNLTLGVFNSSVPCPVPPCTFDGVYQPPLVGNFFAFSGFFSMVQDLGLNLSAPFSLNDYKQAMNNYCNKTWDQVSELRKKPAILVILCFQAQHAYHLLVDFYGFNDSNWQTIQFVGQVMNNEFGWTLGMVLNTTNAIPPHDHVTRVNDVIFIALLVSFSFLVLISVSLALAFCLYRRQTKERTNNMYMTS